MCDLQWVRTTGSPSSSPTKVRRPLLPCFSILMLPPLAVASLFWFAVFSQRGTAHWRAILALLVTSKFYCLLGVLLLFAPVTLYSGIDMYHGHGLGTLVDQQMAGLIMLLACPPTYVLVGIIMAALWLRELGTANSGSWIPTAASITFRQGK